MVTTPVWVTVAVEQYALPKAITVLATSVPQAPFEQSRSPNPKLALLQRQYASKGEHPKVEYWASMLLKQSCPQAGRLDSPGIDVSALEVLAITPVWVAVAVEQYALPKAITVLATSAPQAPLEQSRRPFLKSSLLQRQ